MAKKSSSGLQQFLGIAAIDVGLKRGVEALVGLGADFFSSDLDDTTASVTRSENP